MTQPDSSRPRAVVCLSGGMDSCVCAALAARDYEVYALHFSYGQRTEARELRSAEEMARHRRGARASAAEDGSVPQDRRLGADRPGDCRPCGSADEASIGHEIPVTYVPFRNAHFLSAAVSWAEVLGAKTVFIGAVEQDSSGYPDCRPAYYEAFNRLIQTGHERGRYSHRDAADRTCARARSCGWELNWVLRSM